MSEFGLSYKEVTPYQSITDNWKEINLNTGGTQSTLQDIKVIEKASGYSYKDASKHYTRNRFIYWRISNDILEIVEQSLDLNLTGNKIKYKFVDTPILDGITVHELHDRVIILVPTVCSVHTLSFPHPRRLHRQDDFLGSHPDLSVASIFAEASVAQARDPTSFYIFNNPSTANAQLPHCAASWYSEAQEETLFLLAYPSNEIILVKHSANGENETVELKDESIVSRFLSGIADKFLHKNSDLNVVVSMLLHSIEDETYAFTLSRDGNLRVWTCSNAQCIAVDDILSDTGNKSRIQGVQHHMIRKTCDSDDANMLICVYMSFSTEGQFHIFKPSVSGTQFRFNRINILYSPGIDLVDFSICNSRIWSVWRGEEGECSVFSAVLNADLSMGNHWIPVVQEAIPDASETFSHPDLEPRQTYLQYIFYPGRFPLSIISKALSIYKRSALAAITDVNLSPTILKQRICMAVENEIQSEINECVVNDDEYLEWSNWCWSRFYSCCVQYYVAALRPLGILLLPNVSSAILLKKSMYSVLRPLDTLEHLVICSEYFNGEQYSNCPELGDDPYAIEDITVLVNVLAALDEQLSDLFKSAFEREMAQLRSPDELMSELVTEVILELSEEFLDDVIQRLKNCRDLYQAIHKLLELLRMEKKDDIEKSAPPSDDNQMSINHLFSSLVGVSVVSKTLKQQASLRFSLCRNLLALQNILLEQENDDWNRMESIRTVCMPETVVLTQAYYVMVWVSDLSSSTTLPVESMLQRLSPLKLSPVFNLNLNFNHTVPLLDLFIVSSAGYTAHKNMNKLPSRTKNFVHWQTSLLTYVDQIVQIIWPINANTQLTEWLLISGQHLWLQNYVRLMNNWGEWNNFTRHFLLGCAFLCSSEFHKAYDLFIKAANGIYSDQYLMDKIVAGNEESKPFMLYFLKVIQLFEHHGARSYAINVANSALSLLNDEDQQIATIHSIKFKHHLALGHYEKAYDALNANPDFERKKANLRDFVKTLLEEKQLDLLMSFPYAGLEKLFCSILFTRARATDSISNVYYDFLYAYQIKRGTSFMRLAAAAMYEQAFRLMQYNTMESLEKQVKCYLAAVNALYICDLKFAWVLKPSDPNLEEEIITFPILAGSREKPEMIKINRQIEVVALAEIKKELEFASARLKLARFDENSLSAKITTPNELVALLNNCGLYKTALQVCSTFEVPYDSVFESLAHQCIILTRREDPNSWNWLVENDLHDLPSIANKPSAVIWKLLETYLLEYEEGNRTDLHKVVCDKLLSLKFELPHWILASYKKRNAAELLRIYHRRGYLDDAFTLAMEHIMAALGYGVEHFGFKHGVTPGGPEFCLPVHVIDALLYELELQNNADPKQPFAKEYVALKDLFTKYLETTQRISNQVIRTKLHPPGFSQADVTFNK